MKYLTEIILPLIPLFLFLTGLLLAAGGQLIGFGLILLSIFIWGFSEESENNNQSSFIKKSKSGFVLTITIFFILLLMGIGGYLQVLAYQTFGIAGFLAVGPLGIYILYKIIMKIKISLKGN
jgi:hypothetical protein